jgi:hypothetical protein
MSMELQTQVKAAPQPSFTPVHYRLLQRKCACGGTPGLEGECKECRKKRLITGLDVGALRPPGLGFGPRKKAK